MFKIERNGKSYSIIEIPNDNPYYLDLRPVEDNKVGEPLVYCSVGFNTYSGKFELLFYRAQDNKPLYKHTTSNATVTHSAKYGFEMILILGLI